MSQNAPLSEPSQPPAKPPAGASAPQRLDNAEAALRSVANAATMPASSGIANVSIVFSARDWLLVALAVVQAAGWVTLLDVQAVWESAMLPGLGATLFSLGSFVLALVAIGRKPKFTVGTLFLGVAYFLLALIPTLTGNSTLRFLDCLLLWGTQTYLTFLLAGLWPACWAQVRALGWSVAFFFVSMFRNWTLPARALGQWASGWKQRGATAPKGIGLGILVAAVALAIVVPLLCSADAVYASLFTRLGDALFDISLPGFTWRVVYALIVAPLMFGLLWELAHATPLDVSREAGGGRLRAATMVVVLVALDAAYLVFVAVQFVYLFGGKDAAAMAGGYAAYARSGFFQLAVIAAINVCTSLLAVRPRVDGGARSRMWLRVLNVVLIALTAVILVSAVKRMMLYTDAYGLSLLRMLTLLGMALCAVLLAALLVKTFRPQTGFFRILVVAGLSLWIAFCLINPDAVIAANAVDRYESGIASDVDVDYLARELSYDTRDALLRYQELLASDPSVTQQEEQALRSALNLQQAKREEAPWQMWCIAYW